MVHIVIYNWFLSFISINAFLEQPAPKGKTAFSIEYYLICPRVKPVLKPYWSIVIVSCFEVFHVCINNLGFCWKPCHSLKRDNREKVVLKKSGAVSVKFRKNPQAVPRSCFVCEAWNSFTSKRHQFEKNISTNTYFFSVLYPKKNSTSSRCGLFTATP